MLCEIAKEGERLTLTHLRIFMNVHEQSKIAGAPIGRDKWPIKYGDDARNPSFYKF